MSTSSYLQGELLKRGHFIPSWRRRVFTLRHDYLSGYTLSYCTPDTARIRGAIKISLGTTVRELPTVANGFVVETAGQPEYSLSASSPEERRQWIDAIKTAKRASVVRASPEYDSDAPPVPGGAFADKSSSIIQCTVVEARGMPCGPRSEVYVHVAVGSYVRRTKVGMHSADGDKTTFCETLTLPFQRSNLFAVIDVADQEQRGRVLGRGIVPLLQVGVEPRRLQLPLAAMSRSGVSAGAAGCSISSACTGTLTIECCTNVPVQDAWESAFQGVRTLGQFYRPLLLPPSHAQSAAVLPSTINPDDTIASLGQAASALSGSHSPSTHPSSSRRQAAVLANPLLADTLELPLHPLVRRQVLVQRAVTIGCIDRAAASSIAQGALEAVCDWPPCGSERVEAAAMVLLRPFADARAGLFPGTLFLTNFRLVWIAASHIVPDLTPAELEEMMLPLGQTLLGKASALTSSSSISSVGREADAGTSQKGLARETKSIDTAAVAMSGAVNDPSALAGSATSGTGASNLSPLWTSDADERHATADRLRVVVDQDVDSSDSPGSLSFSIPLRMLVGVTASNSTVMREAAAAVPAMRLIHKSIKRDEALASIALSPLAQNKNLQAAASASVQAAGNSNSEARPGTAIAGGTHHSEPPPISPAAVAAITVSSPHRLLSLPASKSGSKQRGNRSQDSGAGAPAMQRPLGLAGRIGSMLLGRRGNPFTTSNSVASQAGQSARGSGALVLAEDDFDDLDDIDDGVLVLEDVSGGSRGGTDDDDSIMSDDSLIPVDTTPAVVIGGAVIVDDWAMSAHDRSPVGPQAKKPLNSAVPAPMQLTGGDDDVTSSSSKASGSAPVASLPRPAPPQLSSIDSARSSGGTHRRPSAVISSLVGTFAPGRNARNAQSQPSISPSGSVSERSDKDDEEAASSALRPVESATESSVGSQSSSSGADAKPTMAERAAMACRSDPSLVPETTSSVKRSGDHVSDTARQDVETGVDALGVGGASPPARTHFDGLLAALPDITGSNSTNGDWEDGSDGDGLPVNPLTAAVIAAETDCHDDERRRSKTVGGATSTPRQGSSRAIGLGEGTAVQSPTGILGGGVVQEDFYSDSPSNPMGETPKVSVGQAASTGAPILSTNGVSMTREHRSLTQLVKPARDRGRLSGLKSAAVAATAFSKPTRRRQSRMSMAITPAALVLSSRHGPAGLASLGRTRIHGMPPPPPRRMQTAPAAPVLLSEADLTEEQDAIKVVSSPMAAVVEHKLSSPSSAATHTTAPSQDGRALAPAAVETGPIGASSQATAYRQATRSRAGTGSSAALASSSPHDRQDESDEKKLLGSLSLGSDAASAEATLPVLGISASDARAPRFIVIGAGVFPSHEAADAEECDADTAPASHVCEALRTRIAYLIAAARDEETLFVDQAATALKPLLMHGGPPSAATTADAVCHSDTSGVSAAAQSLIASAYAGLAKVWGSRTSLAETCVADFRRQGVSARHWRVCRLNHEFQLCSSYPPALLVPAFADDAVVKACSEFRTRGRLPALTWYHPANGAAIMRSSQPKTGAMGQRSKDDERLLDLTRHASPCPASALAIIDCRPVLSAQANMLKGGGFEAAGQGGYTTCTLQFCGIGNIHAVRKALAALVVGAGKPSAAIVPSMRALQDRHWQRDSARMVVAEAVAAADAGTDKPVSQGAASRWPRWTLELAARIVSATSLGAIGPASGAGATSAVSVGAGSSSPADGSSASGVAFASGNGGAAMLDDIGRRHAVSKGVSESGWVELASSVLAAAVRCVRLVDALGVSVLVHCSDGWDRTSQVCSLAKMLMDPYYRTIEGFAVLVRTDWLHFGHKFQERMGRLEVGSDEASPVFFQWLDCVFQVLRQFPERFEFTEAFLEELVVQSQAGWGGSFLYDTEHQRHRAGLRFKSLPEFAMLQASAARFRNAQYISPQPECLGPVRQQQAEPPAAAATAAEAAAETAETTSKATPAPPDGTNMLRRWNRSLVLIPDFSEQALCVWPLFQRFDRAVYKAIERTQGAAVPTLSMINSDTGGLLL